MIQYLDAFKDGTEIVLRRNSKLNHRKKENYWPSAGLSTRCCHNGVDLI